MLYTIGSVWHLLFKLKQILTLDSLIKYKIEQWSNLLRKTAITTTFYFTTEKENICKRKKLEWTVYSEPSF